MKRNRYYENEQIEYKFDKKAFKKVLKYAVPQMKKLVLITTMMLLQSFVSLVPTMINRYIIDYVLPQTGMWGLTWVKTAVVLLSLWLGIAVGDIIFAWFRSVYMCKVGQYMVKDIRSDAYRQLQKLAFDYFDSRPAGKILVRITSYLDELANIFSSVIVASITDAAKIVAVILWLVILEPRLALAMIVALVPMTVVIVLIRKKLSKTHKELQAASSNRTAYISESILGSTVTQVFNREKYNSDINDELNSIYNEKFISFRNACEAINTFMGSFFYIGQLLTYGVAVYLALTYGENSGLTPGLIISFVGYTSMLLGPINSLCTVSQQLVTASTNVTRVFELAETPPSVFDRSNAYELPEIVGNVDFENVSFFYEQGVSVIENVSFSVPAGKMIALVGPTGAGKTTIVSLLSRFYEPTSGRVLIDGNDVAYANLHSLRSQVGVMMQDTFIFSGTILENIRYAKPEATREECIAAAKLVHADDFISRLPDGYDTATSEDGKMLSMGERQLISLARVVLTDPRILILDEATSSIDTNCENLIKEALETILKGRTSFVIAHRLSTIRKADCIMYIANKGIAEAGTHEQLMAKKGYYYNLVTGKASEDAANDEKY